MKHNILKFKVIKVNTYCIACKTPLKNYEKDLCGQCRSWMHHAVATNNFIKVVSHEC